MPGRPSAPARRLTRRAALAALLATSVARARGRVPLGGHIALRVPFALGSLDPHRVDDPAAALFGEALFDSLYSVTASSGDGSSDGRAGAVLAESAPERVGEGLRVTLRQGLRSAHGRRLDARDAIFSIERARSRGARGWLADIPSPRLSGLGALFFPFQDVAKLLRALSSPLVAIVPTSFSPQTPDGTGAFRAEPREGGLLLTRNPAAARGGSFLASVMIRPASDLAASLRAFETTTDDVGWLGLGLHEPRPGARRFDAGPVAWAILATGSEASSWDRPGVAQALADQVPFARLSSLGVGDAWTDGAGGHASGWGGMPSALLVREDSPWLVELASVVAAALSRPGHEIVARPVAASELLRRREARDFALAIDVARPLLSSAGSPSALTAADARIEATVAALLGLTTADDPHAAEGLGRHPPRLDDGRARSLTRTLRVGVVGEIRAQGGRSAELVLPTSLSGAGLDLGAAYRARSGS